MDEIRIGTHVLQPNRQLLANGKHVHLGPRALEILSLLAKANGDIVTKDEIFEKVWPEQTVEENALQAHIWAIRKALGDDASQLETLRGVGYRLQLADGDVAQPIARDSPSPGTREDRPTATRRNVLLSASTGLTILTGFAAWAFIESRNTRSLDQRPILVLVRPLTAAGGVDQTEVTMARGITDELTIRLRRIPDLQVVRADTEGANATHSTANYIVDGNLVSNEENVRVTARLASRSGEVLWIQTFDQTISDLFAIQEQIAAAIASELSVSLDVGVNSTDYGGTSNPEAFVAYIQYTTHRLDQDQEVPKQYLDRAIQLDPNYIKAMSGQAIWNGMQARRANTRAEARTLLDRMREGVDRALAANPDLWIGHMTEGWYYLYEKDYPSSDESFAYVVSHDEGVDPDLRGFLSSRALIMGRTQESLSLLASNILIDPSRETDRSQVWAFSQGGRHEDALELFRRLDPIYQDSVAVNAFWAHMALGEETKALQFAERRIPFLARMYRSFATDEELRSLPPSQLQGWVNRRYGEGGHLELGALAAFAGYYGENELAVGLLRHSFERLGATPAIFWNPVLSSARETPDFALLMTELGFTEYWQSSGNWPDFCSPVTPQQIACH